MIAKIANVDYFNSARGLNSVQRLLEGVGARRVAAGVEIPDAVAATAALREEQERISRYHDAHSRTHRARLDRAVAAIAAGA